MEETYKELLDLVGEIKLFTQELGKYIFRNLHISFLKFEKGKGVFVTSLYKQRGKMARRLVHTGMATLAGVGMMIAPIVAQEFPGRSVNPWEIPFAPQVLSASTEDPETNTFITDQRDKIIEYSVQDGDTVSTIASKFGISQDTVRWQNGLTEKATIKADQKLQILPVTGISHKVGKGDTVASIAKKYDGDSQAIVDFPFNTFSNDETLELAIGQVVIVPDGVRPADPVALPIARIRQTTPDAGAVSAFGQFVWPTNGVITQRFLWYHPGIDIANKAMPSILAADSGKVVVAGWPDNTGYGNRIIIDHGNGTRTLYGHLSSIGVVVGQTVTRGSVIGRMGSTGRSTGPHLHFEVSRNGVKVNPLSLLK